LWNYGISKRDSVVLYRSLQAKTSIWRNYKTLVRLSSCSFQFV
jgi:hypothetical protein